jgi:hypothetical protein
MKWFLGCNRGTGIAVSWPLGFNYPWYLFWRLHKKCGLWGLSICSVETLKLLWQLWTITQKILYNIWADAMSQYEYMLWYSSCTYRTSRTQIHIFFVSPNCVLWLRKYSTSKHRIYYVDTRSNTMKCNFLTFLSFLFGHLFHRQSMRRPELVI